MKVYVIQNNHRCERKEFIDWSSCKNNYKWNPSTCDCKCSKACKIGKYLEIKNCSCKKLPFGKLVLACKMTYTCN